MIRKIAKMTACFAAGLFALTLGVGAITANEKAKDMSVSEVMKKGHSKTGVIAKLKTAVKGEKWDDAAAAGPRPPQAVDRSGRLHANLGGALRLARATRRLCERWDDYGPRGGLPAFAWR